MRFVFDGTNYNLIDYSKPKDKNYIILESLNQVKENNNYKSIHVITLDEGSKVVMGRGHDADVRINDISVSRLHGTISLFESKLFLKDLNSKFGTLALIQRDFECLRKKVCLQIGRSYIETIIMPIEQLSALKEKLKAESQKKE